MPELTNLFADVPNHLPEEVVQLLVTRSQVRFERIVSYGQSSPEGFWYDQPQHEFVVLLQGAAHLRFEDELLELTPGSCVDIPAHRRHRVEWTAPDQATIWLAIHYGDWSPLAKNHGPDDLGHRFVVGSPH